MIIFRIIKSIIGLGFGLFLSIVLLILIGAAMFDGVRSHLRDMESDYRDVSMIVGVHQDVEKYGEVGGRCICAICMKNNDSPIGAEYTKLSKDMNCCSREHEREYQEIYRLYTSGRANTEGLERYGVKNK